MFSDFYLKVVSSVLCKNIQSFKIKIQLHWITLQLYCMKTSLHNASPTCHTFFIFHRYWNNFHVWRTPCIQMFISTVHTLVTYTSTIRKLHTRKLVSALIKLVLFWVNISRCHVWHNDLQRTFILKNLIPHWFQNCFIFVTTLFTK